MTVEGQVHFSFSKNSVTNDAAYLFDDRLLLMKVLDERYSSFTLLSLSTSLRSLSNLFFINNVQKTVKSKCFIPKIFAVFYVFIKNRSPLKK